MTANAMAAYAWDGGGAGGWDAAAATDATENVNKEDAHERNQAPHSKRFNEWTELQSQLHLSHAKRRDLLRAMALKLSQGNGVGANNLSLGCICTNKAVLRPPVRAFGGPDRRATSVGDLGCQYTEDHVAAAMADTSALWETHDGLMFHRVNADFAAGMTE